MTLLPNEEPQSTAKRGPCLSVESVARERLGEVNSNMMRNFASPNRKSRRNAPPKQSDRSHPSPARVAIRDTGNEYKVSVTAGVLEGKAEPFMVSSTEGLRRKIVDWLEDHYTRHGWRLGVIYFNTFTQRHPKCEACHGYGTVFQGARSRAELCCRCGGAGFVLPGFDR